MTRRRILGLTTGSMVVGLAGCLGGDDDDGESEESPDSDADSDGDQNGDEDSREFEDLERVEVDDMSDEELAEGFREQFLGIVNEPDIEAYNQLVHSGGELDTVEGDGEPFGPRFDATNPTMVERSDDEMLIEMTMEYTFDGEDRSEVWQFELVFEDGEWLLYDIGNESFFDEPAQSPELAVEEFVNHLNAGDASAVEAMLYEDAYHPETIADHPGDWEGIIELEDTTVTERLDGRAFIDASVLITHDDGEQSLEWELILVAIDREWLIGFDR